MATEPAWGCGRAAAAERLRPAREVPPAAAATKPRSGRRGSGGLGGCLLARPLGGRAAPRHRGGGAGGCGTGGSGGCDTGRAGGCHTGRAGGCHTGGAERCHTSGARGMAVTPAVRRDGYGRDVTAARRRARQLSQRDARRGDRGV